MANDLQVSSFTGRLGKDAELKFTPKGDAMLKFSVGVSTGWGDKKITTWWNCVLWGKQAESVEPYTKKGQQVAVSGEASLRQYTTDAGVKGSSLEVRVNTLSLIGGKHEPQQAAPNQSAQDAQGVFGGDLSADDDPENQIPF